MATLNSTQMTNVYGSTTTIAAGTEKAGDDHLFDGGDGIKAAKYSFTSTAAGSGGDVINLVQLPADAVVVGCTFRADDGFGGNASSAITFAYDGTDIGAAITINTGGSSVNNSGTTLTSVSTTGVGLVTMTQSAHAFAADKSVAGEVLYFISE